MKLVAASDEEPGEAALDLTQAIQAAILENRARWVEAREAKRHLDPAWEFVRILQGLETFAKLTVYEAADLVVTHVPNVWKELPSETSLGVPADPHECFWDAWETVEVPEGASSALRKRIEAAVRQALETPPEPDRYGPRFAHRASDRQRTFLRTVELLQEEAGTEPVPIPQGVMAEVLGCHQTEVSRWVRAAERAGLLDRQRKHNRGQRRCAEYRFLPYLDPEIK